MNGWPESEKSATVIDAPLHGAVDFRRAYFQHGDRVRTRVGREMVAKAPRRPNEKQREELERAREASIRDEWLTSIARMRLAGLCRVEEMVEGKRQVRKGENLAWKMGEEDYRSTSISIFPVRLWLFWLFGGVVAFRRSAEFSCLARGGDFERILRQNL